MIPFNSKIILKIITIFFIDMDSHFHRLLNVVDLADFFDGGENWIYYLHVFVGGIVKINLHRKYVAFQKILFDVKNEKGDFKCCRWKFSSKSSPSQKRRIVSFLFFLQISTNFKKKIKKKLTSKKMGQIQSNAFNL